MSGHHIMLGGTPDKDENIAKYIRFQSDIGFCAQDTELVPNVTSVCREPKGHDGPHGWVKSMDAGLTEPSEGLGRGLTTG